MDNWQKDIVDKYNKLKRGDNDVRIRSNSRVIDRSDSRRSRDVNLSERNREFKINNKVNVKGGEKMISAKGALKDYDDIVNDAETGDVAKIVKVLKILIKLLLCIRTNQMGGVKREVQKTLPTTEDTSNDAGTGDVVTS